MPNRKALFIAVAAACFAGCSPALDWREFVPEGSAVSVSFPCRPDRQSRAVTIVGSRTQLTMLTCAAGEATYAFSFFSVADPAHISDALIELRKAAVGNLSATQALPFALQINHMTANANAVRLKISGHLPDGAAVGEHAVFFTRGLLVYEAAVIGAKPDQAAADAFFSALRFPE